MMNEYHRDVRPNVIGYNDMNFSSERIDHQDHNYKKWVKRITQKGASIMLMDLGLMSFEHLQF